MKSAPCVSLLTPLLGNKKQENCWARCFLCGACRIEYSRCNESRQLIFPGLCASVSESLPARSGHPRKGGMTSSCQTPPLLEKETPFQNT
jgi:hypothetical protein